MAKAFNQYIKINEKISKLNIKYKTYNIWLLIDTEDIPKLSMKLWYVRMYKNKISYIYATEIKVPAGYVALAQYILPKTEEKFIVHKNGNKLDFRKKNLERTKNRERIFAINEIIENEKFNTLKIIMENNDVYKIKIDKDKTEKVSKYLWKINKTSKTIYTNLKKIVQLYKILGFTNVPFFKNGNMLDYRISNLTNYKNIYSIHKDFAILTIMNRMNKNINIKIDKDKINNLKKYLWAYTIYNNKLIIHSIDNLHDTSLNLRKYLIGTNNNFITIKFLNGDELDYRINNLQSYSALSIKKSMNKNNTSGAIGVSLIKLSNGTKIGYVGYINKKIDGKIKHIAKNFTFTKYPNAFEEACKYRKELEAIYKPII